MNNADTNLTGPPEFTMPAPIKLKIYLDSAEFSDDLIFINANWCILGKQDDPETVYVNSPVSVYALTEFMKRTYSRSEVRDMVAHDGDHTQKITKRDFPRLIEEETNLFIKEYIERSEEVKAFVLMQAAENRLMREAAAADYWMQNPDLLTQPVATMFEVSYVRLKAAIKTRLTRTDENKYANY